MGTCRRWTMVVAIASLAAAASRSHAQELIQNGDFEQAPPSTTFWGVNLQTGDTRLVGWTIVAGDVDVVPSTLWNPYSGAESLDLNGYTPGTISQTFATIPGAKYELTFALAGNPFLSPVLKYLLVSVGDQSVTLVFDNTGTSAADMRWQRRTLDFVAQGTATTLTFQSLTTDLCAYGGQCSGPALDAVSVTLVALPVAIDIKPGSYPNSINLGSNGVVPVAILSSSTFDATQVDPTTVTLVSASVQLTGQGTSQASFEDVNGDGLVDLVVQVSTQALVLTDTDTPATVQGRTFAGYTVVGTDTVRVVR